MIIRSLLKLFIFRVLWLIIVGLAAAGAINLSLSNWTRFSANPTVVSIQKDFRNWNNAFPSATACYLHKTNDLLIDNYIMAYVKHFLVVLFLLVKNCHISDIIVRTNIIISFIL